MQLSPCDVAQQAPLPQALRAPSARGVAPRCSAPRRPRALHAPRVASSPSSFGDRSSSRSSSSSSTSGSSSGVGSSSSSSGSSSSSSSSSSVGVRSPPPKVGSSGSNGSKQSAAAASSGPLQPPPQQPPGDPASLLLSVLGSETDDEAADGAGDARAGSAAGWAATIGFVAGISILLGGGYVFRGQIKHFLDFFIQAVDDWGVWGYVAYAAVYTGLEVLAVPAIPLTMTAGAIFGPVPGTIVVSASATVAATIAFLIARYAARDKVAALAYRNKRFAAIDRAISRNGLKFVTLLRLSPLLPLAASNYLYGLTSVDLGSYVLGSWLGMLPGTYAYVTAGHVGKAVLSEGEGSFGVDSWQVALALGATVVALGFVGRLARSAVEEADREALEEQQQKDARAAARAAKHAAAAAAAADAAGGAAAAPAAPEQDPGGSGAGSA